MKSEDVFNEDEALDAMTRATAFNDERGCLTLYAVVCPDHGGFVMRNVMSAIRMAKDANDEAPAEVTCQYKPIALSLDPRAMPTFPGEDVPFDV